MKPAAIIDCDPGHDDVMAILLGARVLDLRALTTVFGNASLEQTTRNARQTVEFAELTGIPIAVGMARPLVRDVRHAPEVHGETGLDGPGARAADRARWPRSTRPTSSSPSRTTAATSRWSRSVR